MSNQQELQEWVRKRAAEDDGLYERFGRPLEKDHTGEFVAIGSDGKTILGADELEIARQAIDVFGSGNFALRRVGHRAIGRWLILTK